MDQILREKMGFPKVKGGWGACCVSGELGFLGVFSEAVNFIFAQFLKVFCLF